MMNDTTNQTNPIDDLHVTMEDAPTQTNETPLPVHDYALMASLISTFTKHIERIVDQRFAALVESHLTLALMDDELENKISHMIDEGIENHESTHCHKDDGDIESEVENHMDYVVRQGTHNLVTTHELSEKVSDVLDEILSDRINDALSNASIEISI